MLKKIIGIKNVGRFRNSTGTPNPQFGKYTFITGANGFGKTTICAVLRSLKTGDPAHVLGRKTLGVEDGIVIELLTSTGNVRFDGKVWNNTHPNIAIFDGVFVAENVHSGEVVEIDNKRNLYRVIIGDAGVQLADLEAKLATSSRTKTSDITSAGKLILPHLPQGMALDAFLKLLADPQIDVRITEQENIVRSATQAATISGSAPVNNIPFPSFPADFVGLLARSLDDIANDAEALMAEHLANHDMAAADTRWIAFGVDHSKESCAFCGQNLEGLPLIAAYRSIFSATYKALATEIQAMEEKLHGIFGDAAMGRLDALGLQNNTAVEFWCQYCALDTANLEFPHRLAEVASRLGLEALSLIKRKASAPLETPTITEEFTSALVAFEDASGKVANLNAAINAANELIAAKKIEVAGTDLQSAKNELVRLSAIRTRHMEPAAKLCASYQAHSDEKAELDKQKLATRAALDKHTGDVVEPYERRINELLELFNAGFSIAKTGHGYPGGIATSQYQLVINNVAIDVGEGNTATNKPSFKNTLSAGDRTTLALAFFIVNLENDPDIGNKTAVFDDPFNSQDAFRRRQTVHEMLKVSANTAQLIVLSHDATFLKQIWDKSPIADRVSLAVVDQRSLGSKLLPMDLEKACQGRTATDIDDLQTFVVTGTGENVDLIRKMRVVLETYCRTAYQASFLEKDWLGDMVKKIREGGVNHPATSLYDELDQINEYTKNYHHGESILVANPAPIDTIELTGFTRRTLRIVNALQA
jgi:wobble nucleotide-excising tRNase